MDPTTAIAAGAAVAALGSYMLVIEPFRLQVKELEFLFPYLPPAFYGYSILHLSDLHLTKLGPLEKKAMAIIGSREVDTCFITGDVTAEPRASDIFRRVCSAIRHKDKLYMVLGNSEHKPWLDSEMLVAALTFDGIEMLINSSATIQRGEEKIRIVGVDDPYSRLHDLDAAFAGIDSSEFIVFLTHCPSTTPDAIARGADLILAGHTHGGQIRIPGLGVMWTHMRANRALNDGVYTPADLKRILNIEPGNSTLFVHRGVGSSRIHIRLACPPEIVFITLRRA